MPFDGTEGGQITLAEGAALTAKYRLLNPNGIKARFFGKDCLNTLLNQSDGACKGIRMYFGVNALGENELVLVGADADGNDMLSIVMDLSHGCPKHCSTANVLNGI